MIDVIYGLKGSGKTKRIIDMAMQETTNSPGSVAFIAANNDYMHTLPHAIRLIDASDYEVLGGMGLYAFVQGMSARDYDLSLLFVDGFLKIIKEPLEEQAAFFEKLERFSNKNNIRFVLSVTGAIENTPEFLKQYII